MRISQLTAAPIALALAACGAPEEPADEVVVDDQMAAGTAMQEEVPPTLAADLMTADGEPAGTVFVRPEGDGLLLSVAVTNIPPGVHGVHVHETGSCEPDFSAAGGHWNPTDQSHGLEDPQGQHAGDMPNLEVSEDGTGSLEYTLGGGATFEGLMDAGGSAFIVHAGRDDQVTDPSGDSGDRVACGVFQESAGDTAGTGAM